ncbi:hypothetical protein CLV59_101640 [Chitinophaga dinghuensis]|uniref:Uncharacterized protein n=1 Tax=Chitinophaga dinghuensis TaxID=1539050 RepID=A0A327WCK6_9BACT|nr:hypothetical protein CLV59_101640 [Chitinophaga dinghuensis]
MLYCTVFDRDVQLLLLEKVSKKVKRNFVI